MRFDQIRIGMPVHVTQTRFRRYNMGDPPFYGVVRNAPSPTRIYVLFPGVPRPTTCTCGFMNAMDSAELSELNPELVAALSTLQVEALNFARSELDRVLAYPPGRYNPLYHITMYEQARTVPRIPGDAMGVILNPYMDS